METVVTTDGIEVSVVTNSHDNRSGNDEKEAPTDIARISDAFSRSTIRVARVDGAGGREPRRQRRGFGGRRG